MSMRMWRVDRRSVYHWRDVRLRPSNRRSMPRGEYLFGAALPRVYAAVCCDARRWTHSTVYAGTYSLWDPARFRGQLHGCSDALRLRQESNGDSTLFVHMPRSRESVSTPTQATCGISRGAGRIRNRLVEDQTVSSRVVANIERKKHASILHCARPSVWCASHSRDYDKPGTAGAGPQRSLRRTTGS